MTTGVLVLPANRGKLARVVKIIGYAKNVDKTVRSIVGVVEEGLLARLPGKSVTRTTRAPRSPVVSVLADATVVGSTGGAIGLHLAAIGATTCWLDVPGDPAAATPRPCTGGFAALDAVIGRNTSGLDRTLTIVAFASNGSVVTRQAITIRQASAYTGRVGVTGVGPTVVPSAPTPVAPAVVPAVIPTVTPEVPSTTPPSTTPPSTTPPSVPALSITMTRLPSGTVSSAYSTSLAASGGVSPYSWALGSGSSLPAGLSSSSAGVISGTTVGYGPHAFTVVVTDAANPSATASQALVVYGTYQTSSQNWSGYVITPGPFTGASGTFTVPDIAPTSSSSGTYTSIWVGVDGGLTGNHELIQAGVQLQDYPGGGVQIFPWWEILPATETPISSMGTVSVGDQVTVDIAQLTEATTSTAGSWSITVTDDTTGQGFTTTEPYTGGYTGSAYGEGATVEWVVERPQVNGTYSTLGVYSPTVDFTNLGYAGSTAVGWQDMSLSYQPVVG